MPSNLTRIRRKLYFLQARGDFMTSQRGGQSWSWIGARISGIARPGDKHEATLFANRRVFVQQIRQLVERFRVRREIILRRTKRYSREIPHKHKQPGRFRRLIVHFKNIPQSSQTFGIVQVTIGNDDKSFVFRFLFCFDQLV